MTTTKYFQTKEHKVQACHIREYAGSSINQNDALHLHVKQYIPLHQLEGASVADDAITIIGTHGVGLPKELYEPLWDELYEHSEISNFKIRGIWIADAAGLGASGVLDEGKLSNDCKPQGSYHLVSN
ncbi:toxin biosynthesis protein [Rutstroemia sp. NJR-2017a BBW]|nr:toxin biosynthesis protein [Rutstroemia sp. NJR-2017a BBW]